MYDCTSSNFEGMIASCKPEDSWVCKWQRISKFTKGVGPNDGVDDCDVLLVVAGVRHLCARKITTIHSKGAKKCWDYIQEQRHEQDLEREKNAFVL